MPPKVQLEYLKNQKHTGLSNTEIAILEKKISAVQRKEELLKSAQDYVNTAAQANAIINNLSGVLDIDPGLLRGINRAVEVGTAVVNVVGQAFSGNYIGAIATLTGSLFGGGNDVGTMRHEQIMARFDKLLEGQLQILRELADIKKALNLILQRQQTILQAIIENSRQIQNQNLQILVSDVSPPSIVVSDPLRWSY